MSGYALKMKGLLALIAPGRRLVTKIFGGCPSETMKSVEFPSIFQAKDGGCMNVTSTALIMFPEGDDKNAHAHC